MPDASRYEPAVDLPPIAGFSLRHMRAPDDFAAMTEVANASRIAAGATFLTTVDEMAAAYAHLVNCDLAVDAFTVLIDDRLIGYGRCFWYQERAGARVYLPICFLEPESRRRGIGRAMLRTLETRIAEIATADPIQPAWLQARASDNDAGTIALLHDAGYTPVRYGYTMVRPDLTDITDARLPPGLEIRDVRPEDLRTIFAADQEAFRDSWGAWVAGEADYEEFSRTPMADTLLWRIAWAGDQIAGQVRSFINPEENERYGRRRGWVEHISVRRPCAVRGWRRRSSPRACRCSGHAA